MTGRHHRALAKRARERRSELRWFHRASTAALLPQWGRWTLYLWAAIAGELAADYIIARGKTRTWPPYLPERDAESLERLATPADETTTIGRRPPPRAP